MRACVQTYVASQEASQNNRRNTKQAKVNVFVFFRNNSLSEILQASLRYYESSAVAAVRYPKCFPPTYGGSCCAVHSHEAIPTGEHLHHAPVHRLGGASAATICIPPTHGGTCCAVHGHEGIVTGELITLETDPIKWYLGRTIIYKEIYFSFKPPKS